MAIAIGNSTSVADSGSHDNDGGTVVYCVGGGHSSGTTPTVDSATYNGVSMVATTANNTISFSGSDKGAIRMFHLHDAAIGPNTAAAVITNDEFNRGACVSLKGEKTNGQPNDTGTPDATTDTLNSKIGGIMIAAIWVRRTGNTPSDGLTELFDLHVGGFNHDFAMGYELTTGATETTGWTSTTAAGVFATFDAAAAGSQVIWMWIERHKKFLDGIKKGLIPPERLKENYVNIFENMPIFVQIPPADLM